MPEVEVNEEDEEAGSASIMATLDVAGGAKSSWNFSARPESLQRYRFALRTADFLLCRECGVYIGAVIESEQGRFGIINTHALAEQPADLAATQPISYDAENTGGRIQRREERWTPVTAVPW